MVGLKVVPLGGKGLEPPVLALVVVPKVVEIVIAAGVVVIVMGFYGLLDLENKQFSP